MTRSSAAPRLWFKKNISPQEKLVSGAQFPVMAEKHMPDQVFPRKQSGTVDKILKTIIWRHKRATKSKQILKGSHQLEKGKGTDEFSNSVVFWLREGPSVCFGRWLESDRNLQFHWLEEPEDRVWNFNN